MPKQVSYVVKLIDKTKGGIASVRNNLNHLAATGKGVTGKLAAGFMLVKRSLIGPAGIAAAVAGVGLAFKALQTSFRFEVIELQFKKLLGSVEAAKQRVADLADFAAKTPFEMSGLSEASRVLEVFTEGSLGRVDDTFRLIGDAAAGAGSNIQEVAFWTGRLYSALQSGKPVGEASMRLQEMGILGGRARVEMESLTKAGASADQVFAVLTKSFGRFDGSMEELSTTGSGLVSTLGDEMQMVLKELGDQMQGEAKDSVGILTGFLNDLRESGDLEMWGNSMGATLRVIAIAAAGTAEKLNDVVRASAALGGLVGRTAANIANPVAKVPGPSLANATRGAGNTLTGVSGSIGGGATADEVAFQAAFDKLNPGLAAPVQNVRLNTVNTQNVLSIGGVAQNVSDLTKPLGTAPGESQGIVRAIEAQTDVLKTAVAMD